MRIIGSARAVFVELPAFERHRDEYLDDERFRELQLALMANPLAGAAIEGAGGLRKVRVGDPKRQKGKRGGIRVIYYWWETGFQFWLFTIYHKGEMDDLTQEQRKELRARIKAELRARRAP